MSGTGRNSEFSDCALHLPCLTNDDAAADPGRSASDKRFARSYKKSGRGKHHAAAIQRN